MLLILFPIICFHDQVEHLPAAVNAQLLVQIVDVVFDGIVGNVESALYFLVAFSLHEML